MIMEQKLQYSSYFEAIQQSILTIQSTIVSSIDNVISILSNSTTVVCLGIGKSSFVAQKFASVLKSIGKTAHFVHPTEALHGDLGSISEKSTIVIFSKSGVGAEYDIICQECVRKNISIVLISSSPITPLDSYCKAKICVPIDTEDPFFNTIPSVSFVVNSIISDIIVFGIVDTIGVTKDEYIRNHPAGQIGYLLSTKIEAVCHKVEVVGIVSKIDTLKTAIIQATKYPLGCVCVCEGTSLVGIITDGDIRRYLVEHSDISSVLVESLMNASPTIIDADLTLKDAVERMENGSKKVSVLPVIKNEELFGVLRLHDVLSVSF